MKNYLTFWITISILFLIIHEIKAQNTNNVIVKGTIIDSSKNPVVYATVSLYNYADTIPIKTVIANEHGDFEVKSLLADKYEIRITHLLYIPKVLMIDINKDTQLDTVILEENTNNLSEIVIKANFIDRQADRYTINLKGNPITTGKSLNTVIGLLPGVSNYKGLSINGISGTQVYINGRKVRDIKELDAIQSSHVDNVEVIFNAGSSHDAQSKGGIINITLVKLPDGGAWGSLSVGAGLRSNYGYSTDDINSVINYKYKKINIYNALTYYDFKNIYDYDIIDNYLREKKDIDTHTRERGWSHSFSDILNIVYDINKYHNIGGEFSINMNNSDPMLHSSSLLFDKIGNYEEKSNYEMEGQLKNNNYQTAFNYNWLNEKGTSFKFIVDYLKNEDKNNSNYKYNYQYHDNSSDNYFKNNELINKTNMFEVLARLEHKLKSNSTLYFGGRFYSNRTKRFLHYENLNDNLWEVDENLSDYFKLSGEGYASYVMFSSSIKDFSYSLGIRGQIDKIKYNSYKINENNSNDYYNFFPSLNLGYTLNKEEGTSFNLSYERGLDYIPYSEISPAVRFESEYSYTKGNPDIRPSTDNTFQAAFTLKNNMTFYYNYYQVKNSIHFLTFLDEENPLIKYSIPMNSGKAKAHLVGLDGSVQIKKWWTIYYEVMLRNHKVVYGDADSFQKYESTAIHGGIYNFFNFPNEWAGSINYYGETKEKFDDKTLFTVHSIGLSVQKLLLDQKLKISVDCQPILSKLRKSEINKEYLYSLRKFRTSQTNFKIGVTYNFKTGKKSEIKRTEKIQTIQKRHEKR